MTNTLPTVLLFEDDPDGTRQALIAEIISQLAPLANARKFRHEPGHLLGTYEDRLKAELASELAQGTILMVISDMDLSATKGFVGLSETVVAKVFEREGIPVVSYGSGVKPDPVQRTEGAPGTGTLLIEFGNWPAMARQAYRLCAGFSDVRARLRELEQVPLGDRPRDLSDTIATVVGDPDVTHRVSLYLSGDQRFAASVLGQPQSKVHPKHYGPIGTWIFNSLLQFPGLFVNKVAAASYLNIDESVFGEAPIQNLFAPALYAGPFADTSDPLWWRDRLDQIIASADVEDGRSYAMQQLDRNDILPCMCSVDPKSVAGWYCMATRKPVSMQHSQGNISWFPPGSDLARISSKVIEELGPWYSV